MVKGLGDEITEAQCRKLLRKKLSGALAGMDQEVKHAGLGVKVQNWVSSDASCNIQLKEALNSCVSSKKGSCTNKTTA